MEPSSLGWAPLPLRDIRMSYLISGIILASAVLTAIGIGYRVRWAVITVPAALFGGLSYFIISMYAARLMGEGRFYSFPFGGFVIRDWNIMASTLFWVVAWAVALHLVVPRWKRKETKELGHRLERKGLSLRVLLSIFPFGLTPLLGWLISHGYLNFGGGCKDIIMIFPWMAWSLLYLVIFLSLTIKKKPLKVTLEWSVGGATGIIAVLFAVLFVWSFAG